jgi:hypothetical protein
MVITTPEGGGVAWGKDHFFFSYGCRTIAPSEPPGVGRKKGCPRARAVTPSSELRNYLAVRAVRTNYRRL